jgi:hypothetical protein
VGRRVWSDPRVAPLMSSFVLAADEVWRLQNDGDPECTFFRRATHGSDDVVTGSMQGIYVFAPSGEVLARRNTNDAAAVAELLDAGLAKWDELPEADRGLADPALVAPGFRWEQSYPEDGLVLRRTARDLPADGDSQGEAGGRFNRDAVWFSADEARAFLAELPEVGQRHELPDRVTQRLSCLVLVDNVGGQTVPYHPTEDTGSKLWTTVEGIDRALVSLSIHGHTGAVAKGPWLFDADNYWAPPADRRWPHSISTKVLGSATFDMETQRFVDFELLALGTRAGRTVNQARRDPAPSGVGFFCELAPKGWRVPPTFINVYDVPWVAEPE